MKIGIVSDTHGKAGRLEKALDVFDQHQVEAVVHCGDIGSVQCMEVLASSKAPVYAVPGNMDRDVATLQQAAEEMGIHFSWEVIEVPVGGEKRLVATHGNDRSILRELVADGQYAYVCHGHTHRFQDELIGKVRVINPGALYHTWPHTVAVLDTETDTVEKIHVH